MLSPNIDDLSLSELCELLVTNTTELLSLMNQKGSGARLLRDKKVDVEMIQSAIIKKKAESPGSLATYSHFFPPI